MEDAERKEGQRVRKEGMRDVKGEGTKCQPRVILPGLKTYFAPSSTFKSVQGQL